MTVTFEDACAEQSRRIARGEDAVIVVLTTGACLVVSI